MKKGYLAFILHAHLPYVRHPEYQNSLEENWLYEAITETYLPLLMMLDRLIEDGIDVRLTFSLTPTLTAMLSDSLLQSRYLYRLERLIELGKEEIRRTRSQSDFNRLARFYHQHLMTLKEAYRERYRQDLVGAFKRLQDMGTIEIIASAATHGYLPLLLVNPSAVRAQIKLGIECYRHAFGRKPSGFWLPECAYCRELDTLLQEQDIRYYILETHGITRAEPRPRCGVYAPIVSPQGITALGRDPESSKHVWSATEGYPGDFDYREFYRDIGYDLDLTYLKRYIHPDGIRIDTGFKYYRITSRNNHKEVYVPEWAEQKACIHAGNFMFNREKQVEYLSSVMDRPPIITAPYDAELFGHWWFEGPQWLEQVIRKTASEQKTFRLINPSEYLEKYPPNHLSTPAISSWGANGFHGTWLNEKNHWIYPHLHSGASLMQHLAQRHPRSRGGVRRALQQAARELLLAQASDWAFMITSGQTEPYARLRVKTHLERFGRLAQQIEAKAIDEAWLATLENQVAIFPTIDYRVFA